MPERRRRVLTSRIWALVVVLLFVGDVSLILPPRSNAQNTPPASIQFTNITEQAGIKFKHFKGNKGISINREEFGPGVCVADFDGDGWQDIYFVNGKDLYDRGISATNALYRNNHDGTFTDVTDKAGVPGTGYGLGCVWGDFDNDGSPDLFVTQFGKNVLYRNNGNGTFTDVTDKAGVGGLESGGFHSGATFLDYDRDGWLDLYVGSYVNLGDKRYCKLSDVLSSCAPSEYHGSPDALYHNNHDGTFTNVTQAAAIYQPLGKNLSVQAGDYDNDG
jgi:enediyne biosynthesis protein E4